MDRKTVITIIVVFIVIVAGMFLYAQMKSSEISNQQVVDTSNVSEDTEPGPYDSIDRIDAKHFFIDGTHTLAGEIIMPTPCDLLDWDVQIAESLPEQVTVGFNVINNADVCAQVLTPQRFKVDFQASENASIRATLAGREIDLNLIPAGEDETPDDFELFIKG